MGDLKKPIEVAVEDRLPNIYNLAVAHRRCLDGFLTNSPVLSKWGWCHLMWLSEGTRKSVLLDSS